MFKEKNIIIKNPLKAGIRFGLVYPNVYKTAMSSLGYQIIYNYINEREDTYSERIIYPSTRSLETNSPLSDFDIVSFSLQYEQDYFHVLEMLREADIPLRREDRTSDDPLIIAGGPCASANPLPLSDFIDIFVVGEAEAVLYDFLDLYSSLGLSKRSKKNRTNEDIDDKMDLSPFLDIEGLYISEFNNETNIVLSEDMESIYHLTCPIVTETDDKDFIPAFSNSILLNVSRACTRGCRFCILLMICLIKISYKWKFFCLLLQYPEKVSSALPKPHRYRNPHIYHRDRQLHGCSRRLPADPQHIHPS